ncbi:MAG: apolipoprotein N-acyltransferase [Magnetococcales bacterium]|nr:apolipoprotein N-acyltransferase [Magnetococcales bacterium]
MQITFRRAIGYALLAGGVAVLGLPSGPTPVALMLGLLFLILLLRPFSPRQGAWLGFFFGLSHFSLGFSWLLTSLHQYGGIPWLGSVLILVGFAALMALYPALFGALLNPLSPRPWLLPLAAPALWVVTEWLRAHLFSGFAWNLVGYGWERWSTFVQIADVGGVFLLSWLMVLPAAVGAACWLERATGRSVWLRSAAGLILLLGALHGYGEWRLTTLQNKPQAEQPPSIRVAIVQGNIPQQLKWATDQQKNTVERYLQLSRTLALPVDLVVWPETAMAFFFRSNPDYLDQISQLSRELAAPILTGTPTIDRDSEEEPWRYYNSMVLLDESGSLDQRYDKHHLVPFGEFIPLRAWLPAHISKFTAGTEDFSSGPGPVPLPWHKGEIGPLICYEAIFPDEVRQLANTGVRWLINITNDGWFGDSAKPQHLAMVRLRAVENRLPMIRSANTGISAVFDASGQELGRIPPDQAGTVTVTVPPGSGESLYRQWGDLWIGGWLSLLLLSGWLGRRIPATGGRPTAAPHP